MHNLFGAGSGTRLGAPGITTPQPGGGKGGSPSPAPPPATAPTAKPFAVSTAAALQAAVSPAFAARLKPEILTSSVFRPDIFRFPLPLIQKTTTQLAQGAITQLNGANPEVLREAINTIRSKNIAAGGLINYLERKVKVGEVLQQLAANWSDETKRDFAEAFQMDAGKLPVMDLIVSIAILNDPDLDEEIRIENTPETTEGDLLENRRIVWQYPQPGTPLEPPYVVLVAVEHKDVAKAEDVVKSIFGELVDFEGYKIPKLATQKLR